MTVAREVRAVVEASAEDRVSLLTPELRELLYGPLRAASVEPEPSAAAAPEPEQPPAAAAVVHRTRDRRMRRTLRRVASTASSFIVGALLLLTAGPFVLPFHSFFIRSGSMKPGLPVGSLVVSTRAAASDLRVGDVISFDRPDHPGDVVTHRIVAIEETATGHQFVTKGDANGTPDPWRVPAVGDGWKYTFSLPYAGYAVGYSRLALAAIGQRGAVAIMGAVFALLFIWRTPRREPSTPSTTDVAA